MATSKIILIVIMSIVEMLLILLLLWHIFSKEAKQIRADKKRKKEQVELDRIARVDAMLSEYRERMVNDPEFRQEQQEYERINRQEEKMKRDNDFNFMRDFCGQDPD